MHRIPTGQESPIRSTFHRDAISRIDRSPKIVSLVLHHQVKQTYHVVVGLLLSLLLLLLSLLGLGSSTTSSGGGGRATTSTSGWDGSELLGSLSDELYVSDVPTLEALAGSSMQLCTPAGVMPTLLTHLVDVLAV